MLPALILEKESNIRMVMLDSLDPFGRDLQVLLSTPDPAAAGRAGSAEKGILLALIGVHTDQLDQCLKLGTQVMKQNRDNYTVYLVHDTSALSALLMGCMRPAGILPDVSALPDCLERIMTDYRDLVGEPADQPVLVVESEGTAYRVPFDQILYVEATDKKLNICTDRQQLVIRESLGSLAEKLPDYFLQCHRSYVVNTHRIASVSFTDMMMTLSDDEMLPFSRSKKAAVKAVLDAREEKGA